MSHSPAGVKNITTQTLIKKKSEGELVSMVTCYDSAFGHLVEKSAIDVVLVGDSLGNVVLGYDSTIPVTIEDMVHHTAAVTRVVKRPLVVADMPFMSYSTIELALANAAKLLQIGGAAAVKMEGGKSICPQVKALVDLGIPVMGHLGLTPQSVHALGGYKVQAKSKEAKERLIADALALQEAGVFALVLELIPESLAKEVSSKLAIPTIGIGAGPGCDGQVLVLHDLLGFNKDFSPKFLKKYADLDQVVTKALNEYDSDVKTRKFPSLLQSFE